MENVDHDTLNLPGWIWLYLHLPVIFLSHQKLLRFASFTGIYGLYAIQAMIDVGAWYVLLKPATLLYNWKWRQSENN